MNVRRRRAVVVIIASSVLVTVVMVAILLLARREPAADSQLLASQARALAESGLERSLWALSNAGAPGALRALPAAGVAAEAPYDGSTFVPVGPTGGFMVRVAGLGPNQATVVAVGWSPTNAPSDGRAKAKRRIEATVARLRDLAREAPCVLCVGAHLTLAGGAKVDARPSGGATASGCGEKIPVWAAGGLTLAGAAEVLGGPLAGLAARASAGADVSLSDDDLDILRSKAKFQGTYLRPASDAPLALTRLPDGLVFVDTLDGSNPTAPPRRATLARVRITAGSFASQPFKGWIVVNGAVDVGAGFGGIRGIVYAADTITTSGFGDDAIDGIVIARHVSGAKTASLSDARIVFDCGAARGAGHVPTGWFVRPGTYREGQG